MNPQEIEQQLAECYALLSRLGILALRQPSVITASEFFDTIRHIKKFCDLPEPFQEKIREIREERWGIV